MRQRISWDDLIKPVGADRFEAEYFGTKPLHLKDCFAPRTGLESLSAWSRALKGQSVAKSAHRGIVTIDPNTDQTGSTDPLLDAALARGGPLIIEGINKINPAVEALAGAIAHGVTGYVGVNAYISPRRKDALDLHFDDHDVIVLQLHGSKQWTLASRVVRGVAQSKHHRIDQAPLKQRAIETDDFSTLALEPGDLLYLPRGLFHRATARDAVSVHLSFGVRRPTGMDFVELLLRHLLRDPAAREVMPRLDPGNGNAAVKETLNQLTQKLRALGHDDTVRADFVREYERKFAGLTDRGGMSSNTD